MNARLQQKVVLKRQRDYVFTDVSYIRVDITLPGAIRQATKIGRGVNDQLILIKDESVQMNRHQQDVAHRGAVCLRQVVLKLGTAGMN